MKSAVRIILVLLAGGAIGWGLASGRVGRSGLSRPLVPTLRCLDAVQELGEVWQTDALKVEFHLVNEDREATFDVSVRGSCLCTEIEPKELTLAPGEKATVKATIDLERLGGPRTVGGAFEEKVVAYATSASGASRLVPMLVRGTVRESYRVTPELLSFGQITQGDTLELTTQVECLAPEPATGFELVSVPAGFTASFSAPVPDGREALLTVRAEAGLPEGPINAPLRFCARLRAGRFVARSVALRGSIVSDVHVLPSAVIFGAVPLGEERSAVVTLTSRRGEHFTIDGVRSSSAALTVAERSRGTSAHQYTVVLRPEREGVAAERVRFRFHSEQGTVCTVELPVRAYVTGVRRAEREGIP